MPYTYAQQGNGTRLVAQSKVWDFLDGYLYQRYHTSYNLTAERLRVFPLASRTTLSLQGYILTTPTVLHLSRGVGSLMMTK